MISNPLIYYLQTDLVCVAALLFILLSENTFKRRNSTEDTIFDYIVVAVIVFCIADLGSWYFDGQKFYGARMFLYISNIVYIAMSPIISILWIDRSLSIVEGKRLKNSKVGRISVIFLIGFLILIISTPFTDFAFTLSEDNHYTRSIGAYLGPVFTWIHFLGVTLWIVYKGKKGGRLSDKDLINMVFKFVIPVLGATILQLCFFGLTMLGVGFLISIVILYIDRQKNQISTDELTGLNNRRELNKYLEYLNNSGKKSACVCLIDIDRFKQINDKFGHLEGDKALKTVASVLKKSCAEVDDGWFLARFGGDEFVLASSNKTKEDILIMKETVEHNLQLANEQSDNLYKLEISFGYGEGDLSDKIKLMDLLAEADQYMYKAKKEKS